MVIKWIIHPQNWHLLTIVSFHGVGPHLLSVTSSGQSKTYLLSPPHVTWILSVLSNQHQPQNSCNSLDSRHWVRLIRIYTISSISKSFWRNPQKPWKLTLHTSHTSTQKYCIDFFCFCLSHWKSASMLCHAIWRL